VSSQCLPASSSRKTDTVAVLPGPQAAVLAILPDFEAVAESPVCPDRPPPFGHVSADLPGRIADSSRDLPGSLATVSKNHSLFFAAAKRVLAQVPKARFLLVGDQLCGSQDGSDVYKACMSRFVEELGLRERCLFLGNRDDVERVYPACHVTVLSSLYEGTPNVLLESMACGVPVVATDVSDNRYVVPDGEVGYIVPLDDVSAMADRICRLLANEDLRQQLGKQARTWTEREFSISQLAKRTEAVYLEALASHPAYAPSA